METDSMKTNIAITLLAVLAPLSTTSCGKPEQKIRLKVEDEAGKPVAGAACAACWWRDVFARATTDAKGIVEFQGETGLYQTHVWADASGYYRSSCYRFLMDTTKGRTAARWEPWPVELTFVMKKIVRPHPMYFITKCDTIGKTVYPEKALEKQHGYDLIERDWVAPHGKGKVADFLITGSLETPGDTSLSPKSWVALKFSNPQDGIIEYKNASSGGSDLQGPHEAPETGYLSEFKFPNWFDDVTQNLGKEHKWSLPMYVFRVRTVTDKEGRIVSARYGKLLGGIEGNNYYKLPGMFMTYYLNGADNDRGLEWDMKNNLFKDLQGKCSLMGGNKP